MDRIHSPRCVAILCVSFFAFSCEVKKQELVTSQMLLKADTLTFDQAKDTLLFGAKGTALFLERESFVLPDGRAPSGDITLVLKECFSYSDMVVENLSTISNGRLLETGGMINVQAFAVGEKLSIKNGKNMIVHFPKDSADQRNKMSLFYGERDTNDNIDWERDSMSSQKAAVSLRGWDIEGFPWGDSTANGILLSEPRNEKLENCFRLPFDASKFPQSEGLLGATFHVKFSVGTAGTIKNIVIKPSDQNVIRETKDIEKLIEGYISNLPKLSPFYKLVGGKLKPFEAKVGLKLVVEPFLYAYMSNTEYQSILDKMSVMRKDSSIRNTNAVELNYFIFSTSKLGWINCDQYWDAPGGRTDYTVKANAVENPIIKLIFKNAKTIMTGQLQGSKVIFSGVPADQPARLVAIIFDGNQPKLAVEDINTSDNELDKLNYGDFAIRDLEEQINLP